MQTRSFLLIGLASAAAVACGDPAGPERQVVEVMFTSDITSSSAAFHDVSATVGANTLVISRAELVIRRIKVTTDSLDCDDSDNGRDGCPELLFGPALAILPLATDFKTAFSGLAPQGMYRRIEFNLHLPGKEPGDTAFVAGNPDFSHSSIVVQGTYNGVPFQFTSALSETIRLDIAPAMPIDGPHASITVNVDVLSWFRNSGGLVDPSSGNVGGSHEMLVRTNILKSFRAAPGE